HNTAQTVTIKEQTIDVKGYYYIIKDDLSKENVIKFIDYISCLSFSEVYDTSDTNEAFEKFHDLLILFYKLCFPSIRVKKKCNVSKPKWITRGIKTSSKHKRSLRFIYYLNKINENKNRYKNYSKILRKCMYNLQALCNQTYIAQSHNKVKATWNVVKHNTGKIKCRNNLDFLKDNNTTTTSGSDIANTFNKYFVNVAKNVICYGIIVWGNSVDISRVFIAQKKCIRAIFNLKWSESCRPVFQSNKLLTVPSIYIYEVAKFIRANPALFEVKDNVNKRKATRVLLQMPVPRLELFRRNCVYMAPLIYNTLPKSITELPYKKFCITLKKRGFDEIKISKKKIKLMVEMSALVKCECKKQLKIFVAFSTAVNNRMMGP
ncbi:hypothetical protein SFRURICE_000968, partial [Spodoptera frugiperda]